MTTLPNTNPFSLAADLNSPGYFASIMKKVCNLLQYDMTVRLSKKDTTNTMFFDLKTIQGCTTINEIMSFFFRKLIPPTNHYLSLGQTERKEIALECLYEYTRDIGSYLVDQKNPFSDQAIYYLKGSQVVSIQSDEYKRKFMIPEIFTHCRKEDFYLYINNKADTFDHVMIHNDFYYDESKNVLYISDRWTGFYLISPETIIPYENGNFGIYFKYKRGEQESIALNLQAPKDLREYLGSFNYQECFLTKQEYQDFIYAYMLMVPFESIIKEKPILLFTGEKGSGKSTLAGEIMRFLISRHSDVIKLSQNKEDFLDVLFSNKKYCVLDNVENKPKYLEDALATVSSGSVIPKRELYTTNDLVEFTYNCFVAITAINPQFKRADVADRLIIINLQRFLKFMPTEFMSITADHNLADLPKYYAQYFLDLQKMLRILPTQPLDSDFRLAACFRILTCGLTVLKSDVNKILTKIEDSLQDYAMNDDELIQILLKIKNREVKLPKKDNMIEGFLDVPDYNYVQFKPDMTGHQLMEILQIAGLSPKYTIRQIISKCKIFQSNLLKSGIRFSSKIIRGRERRYNIDLIEDLPKKEV